MARFLERATSAGKTFGPWLKPVIVILEADDNFGANRCKASFATELNVAEPSSNFTTRKLAVVAGTGLGVGVGSAVGVAVGEGVGLAVGEGVGVGVTTGAGSATGGEAGAGAGAGAGAAIALKLTAIVWSAVTAAKV